MTKRNWWATLAAGPVLLLGIALVIASAVSLGDLVAERLGEVHTTAYMAGGVTAQILYLVAAFFLIRYGIRLLKKQKGKTQ